MGVRSTIRQFFSPEPDFFGLLREHAEAVDEGVRAFDTFMRTGLEVHALTVRAKEKEADELRRTLRADVFASFSTPIDREDLFYLSRRLDEVINYVKHTVRDIQVLDPEIPPKMLEMSEVLVQGSHHLLEAVRRLQSRDKICHRHARAAKNCENDLTKLYPHVLGTLFERDDVKEILKQHEILRNLTHIADRIDEVADVILHIVVKEA